MCGVAAAVALVACRDPAREQAERAARAKAESEARDQVRLETIVNADEAFDRVLKSADDASHAGDEARAAALLEDAGARASDEALAEAEREPLETAWGRARRDAIVAVMRDRRGAIAPYARALRGDDIDAKLAAIEAQVALQKRAMEAAQGALSAPDSADAG